jgi:putative ABC transport system permease protein
MIKHLFKLIWNKKKQNFLLMTEILVSFMVIFAVFTLLVYYYNNYKKPMGFEYENVWTVSYNNAYNTKNTDSLVTFYENLRRTIKTMPQVKDISFCSDNVPFFQNTWSGGATYNNIKVDNVNQYTVEDSYNPTMTMQLLSGRWYTKDDIVLKDKEIVINSELKEKMFGNGEAIGKLIGDNDGKNKRKVIGVVQSIKSGGDYLTAHPGVYYRADTSAFRWFGRMMVLVTPDADAAFEGRLYKTMANYMKNSDIEIGHLVNKRTNANLFAVVPMIVLSIVGCFLIINVALGLFGVLWYNINKRRGEIGLRRAVGATGKSVSSQLIAESMILATLALIIGSFFTVQFPLLNVFDLQASIYIIALVLSLVFIYLLVFICSLYPGRQAAAIYPAVALHEE